MSKKGWKQIERPQSTTFAKTEWWEYKGRKYSIIDLLPAYDWSPYHIEVADITDENGIDVFDERYRSFEEAYDAVEMRDQLSNRSKHD